MTRPGRASRLDYQNNHPVAAVVYTRQSHVINVFSFPGPSGTVRAPRVVEDRGYHVIAWADGHMQFCAVSDVNSDEFMEFVRLIQLDTESNPNAIERTR